MVRGVLSFAGGYGANGLAGHGGSGRTPHTRESLAPHPQTLSLAQSSPASILQTLAATANFFRSRSIPAASSVAKARLAVLYVSDQLEEHERLRHGSSPA